MRRLSTRTFGLRLASQLDSGAKITEALHKPQVLDILETMDAHDCATFFLIFPYQVFKTLLGQLHLLRDHYVRGRAALWYGPTEKFQKDFALTKLNLLIEASDCLQRLTPQGPGQRSKDQTLTKIFAGGASHRILSAQAEPDRTGKSAEDIYRDETHLYEPGWMKQISNRRGDYGHTYTETDMTTGLLAGTDAAHHWKTTDQRTWLWRCPACHKFHEPRYLIRAPHYEIAPPLTDATPDDGEIVGGLIYEKHFDPEGLPHRDRIAPTLRYQCPRCRRQFADSPGLRTAFNGTAEKPRGLYVAKNAAPATPGIARAFGWTCHGVALRAWLDMVLRFETAQLARKRGDLEPLNLCIREEFAGIFDLARYLRPQTANRHQHYTPEKLEDGTIIKKPTPYKMREPW